MKKLQKQFLCASFLFYSYPQQKPEGYVLCYILCALSAIYPYVTCTVKLYTAYLKYTHTYST